MGAIRTKILTAREVAESFSGQIQSFEFQSMARSEETHASIDRVSRTSLLPVSQQIHPVIYQVESPSTNQPK